MATRVVVPTQLRSYTGGQSEVEASGTTLDDVLRDLDRQFPGFRFRVIDEQDRVRRHVIIFVGRRARGESRCGDTSRCRCADRGRPERWLSCG